MSPDCCLDSRELCPLFLREKGTVLNEEERKRIVGQRDT